MEKIEDGGKNKAERLRIITIQRLSATIEIISSQITSLGEAKSFYEIEINSQDTPEEDKRNYLKQVEQIEKQIAELHDSIKGLKKSIESLSAPILQNYEFDPNSKPN